MRSRSWRVRPQRFGFGGCGAGGKAVRRGSEAGGVGGG